MSSQIASRSRRNAFCAASRSALEPPIVAITFVSSFIECLLFQVGVPRRFRDSVLEARTLCQISCEQGTRSAHSANDRTGAGPLSRAVRVHDEPRPVVPAP